ncbi:MAG: sulfotransferase, partial [Proteobacteria bacterium]|nr:sulfotransferase [Pseudomonadota bacterium]
MLKKIALWIPHLRTLHEERNRYAQAVQRLEFEKNQMQLQIALLTQSSSKAELSVLTERVDVLSAGITGLDEKITVHSSAKTELSDLSKRVNTLSDGISGLDEKISTQLIQKDEKSSNKPEDNFSLTNRGLFVVGHARSGTTILLDALNSSRDVYCLGEANLHKTVEKTDFCNWFNAMHRSFNNPLMKSSYLPDFSDQSGWGVLKKMSESYKFVGEKVAFRQEELGYDYVSFFNFSAKYFQSSNYICVIRHPRSVSASNIEMFTAGRLNDDTLEAVAISQMQCYYLIMCLASTLKNVFVIVHERIEQNTFNYLGSMLDINLDKAGSYYDFKKTVTSSDFIQKIPMEGVAKTVNYYERFVGLFSPETLRPISSLNARNLLFELYEE